MGGGGEGRGEGTWGGEKRRGKEGECFGLTCEEKQEASHVGKGATRLGMRRGASGHRRCCCGAAVVLVALAHSLLALSKVPATVTSDKHQSTFIFALVQLYEVRTFVLLHFSSSVHFHRFDNSLCT